MLQWLHGKQQQQHICTIRYKKIISIHNMHSINEGKVYYYIHTKLQNTETPDKSYLCTSFNNPQENLKK